MAVAVTLMMASRGLMIVGSGTSTTRISPTPNQQFAFMSFSFAARGLPVARGRLPANGRDFAGFHKRLIGAQVFADLLLRLLAEDKRDDRSKCAPRRLV